LSKQVKKKPKRKVKPLMINDNSESDSDATLHNQHD